MAPLLGVNSRERRHPAGVFRSPKSAMGRYEQFTPFPKWLKPVNTFAVMPRRTFKGRVASDTSLYGTAGLINQHSYTYNTISQVTRQTFNAANYTDYTYDNIGQLKTAKGTESDAITARKQEQFGYAYDAAGNLNFRTNNGLLQNFSVNSLNELSNSTRSGAFTAAGSTRERKAYFPGDYGVTSVTVNGAAAALYDDATFAKEGLSLSDGNNTFTAVATDQVGRTDTDSVTTYLPATNSFTYDLNGNLTSDGHRAFEYDFENQLTNVYVSNAWHSEFQYDGKMRRRIRREFTWLPAGNWQLTNEVHYIYDGNLVIEERDFNNLPQVTYTRGRDLSGSLEGAGGIGGLLARTDHHLSTINSPLSTSYYHSDGNGNITCLISSNQQIVAKYIYDPFGNTISKNGALADANVYRFSSKEIHISSGFYYYGYRWYAPAFQRWINRDPSNDSGFVRVQSGLSPAGLVPDIRWAMTKPDYVFLANSPGDFVDPLGLDRTPNGRATLDKSCTKPVFAINDHDPKHPWQWVPLPGGGPVPTDGIGWWGPDGKQHAWKIPNTNKCKIHCDDQGYPTGKPDCSKWLGLPSCRPWAPGGGPPDNVPPVPGEGTFD